DQAQASPGASCQEFASDDSEHRQRNWRRDQVECADVFLRGANEADESEGVQAIYRRIQFVPAGFDPAGVSERSESERFVRINGRRLCGWKAAGNVLQREGRECQREGFTSRYTK